MTFLDRHGAEAERLGWTVLDLLGVHPVVGTVRPDSTGALLLEVGGFVAAVEADAIRFANGLTLRRGPGGPSVPVWRFGCEPSA